MPGDQADCVIMFADISGSTRLFEALGDQRARDLIAGCLDSLSEIVRQEGGIVVKTIGDEIMTRFTGADAAVKAAIRMHKSLSQGRTPPSVPMSIRIGMHAGPAIFEQGDVFGDVVNLASRVATVARAGDIIATRETIERLSPDLAELAREFEHTRVKGRQDAVSMYEVLWEEGQQVTVFAEGPRKQSAKTGLRLLYREVERSMDQDAGAFVIGRGDQCNLVVRTPLASRIHARIEYRHSRFILIDESTNGTCVRPEGGEEIHLRRGELPLAGSGVISLGRPVSKETEDLIHFSCL